MRRAKPWGTRTRADTPASAGTDPSLWIVYLEGGYWYVPALWQRLLLHKPCD